MKLIDALKRKNVKLRKLNSFASKTDAEVASLIRVNGDGFLYTNEWKELKAKVHDTYGYTCMCCKKTPKFTKNSNVDHIKPRRFFPDLSLCFDNLQVLCGSCNKRKGNKHFTDYRNKSNVHPA